MHKQHGFGVIEIIVIIGVAALLGGLGWYVWQANNKPAQQTDTNQTSNTSQLQQSQKNTQAKNDTARVASALTEYASNNMGSYPHGQEQLDNFADNYVPTLMSPFTDKAYTFSTEQSYQLGVINVVAGTCKSDNTGVDDPQTSRQFAVLTKLGDNTLYCTDL